MSRVRNVAAGSLLGLYSDLIVGIIGVSAITYLQPRLGFLVMFSMVGCLALSILVQRPLPQLATDQRLAHRDYGNRLMDALNHIRIIKLYGAVDQIESSVTKAFLRSSMASRKREDAGYKASSYLHGSGAGMSAIVLTVTAYWISRGKMSPGALLYVWLLSGLSRRSVQGVGPFLQALPGASIAVAALEEFHNVSDEEGLRGGNACLWSEARSLAAISFEQVSLTFSQNKQVLSNVSFSLEGGVIGIAGASGSGKTSIANIIVGAVTQSSGKVTIAGVPLQNIPVRQLRSIITLVPQDSSLLNLNVEENIALGMDAYVPESLSLAAKIAQVHSFVLGWELGYNTMLGPSGQPVSSGQRQRIALARAIIRDPAILILDEATSHIDAVTERAILDRLVKVRNRQDRMTIIVTHRLASLDMADTILVLKDGVIVETGSQQELLKMKETYTAMFKAGSSTYTVAPLASSRIGVVV